MSCWSNSTMRSVVVYVRLIFLYLVILQERCHYVRSGCKEYIIGIHGNGFDLLDCISSCSETTWRLHLALPVWSTLSPTHSPLDYSLSYFLIHLPKLFAGVNDTAWCSISAFNCLGGKGRKALARSCSDWFGGTEEEVEKLKSGQHWQQYNSITALEACASLYPPPVSTCFDRQVDMAGACGCCGFSNGFPSWPLQGTVLCHYAHMWCFSNGTIFPI